LKQTIYFNMENWIKGIDYPEWMVEEGLKTLKKQHLLENETPRQMYVRIVDTLSDKLYDMFRKQGKLSASESKLRTKKVKSTWFDYLWKGWLSPSTPILSNLGSNKGFTISCFVAKTPDNLKGIYNTLKETALLTKYGGGVGITFEKIRGRGEAISEGGFTEGVVPFIKVFDSAVVATAQGGTRRGAFSINLPIRHKDINEFLKIRLPEGDVNRQCLNINHCVTIDDFFMEDIINGNTEARNTYAKILSTRMKTGQPYIMYYHNVHNQRPDDMKKRNLKVNGTNICCLAGSTEVLTKEGVFKIKDLVGKEVTIFDGNDWVKCNNFKSFGEDEVIRVHFKNGSYVDANKNHRWFAAKSYEDIRRNKYYETFTSDLKVGMWLESNFKSYFGSESMRGAYIKGFLLGDGTSHSNRPLLNVHFTKYACLKRLIESVKELKQNEIINSNTILDFSFSDEVINTPQLGKQRFKRLKGLTSVSNELLSYCKDYKQNLPDFTNLNEKDKLMLLSGILDADGTYSKGIQISSVHEKFIKSLQSLIFSIGYSSNFDICKHEGRTTVYRLSIGSYDSFELFDKLFCVRLKKPSVKPNRRLTDYKKITKIEYLKNKEEVFCPTIPTTGKFLLSNGVLTGNSEILSYHDYEHTVVCDLASVNIAKYDEWKNDNDFIEHALLFLDVNLQEFIENAKNVEGFENAVRFAEKSRLLGLGWLGFHAYLQQNNIPFISFATKNLIKAIGSKLKKEGDVYNKKYGKLLGAPEWCDTNRNLCLFAIAPTTTTSLVMGGVSQGIEPIIANAFIQKSSKGTFIRRNKNFEKLIREKYPEKDTPEFWNTIETTYKGSVQHCEFLTDLEKEVYLTAYEINQLELVKQAAIMQQYVDQGISLNLFFPSDVEGKWLSNVHLEAWKQGLKTLYYLRTESIASRNMNSSTFNDCYYCEG